MNKLIIASRIMPDEMIMAVMAVTFAAVSDFNLNASMRQAA
jgi:hypothetical protein